MTLPSPASLAASAAPRPQPHVAREAAAVACLMVGLHLAMYVPAMGLGAYDLDRFCQFDCGWYQSVAENGYLPPAVPVPKGEMRNTAFFPAFPIVGWAVRGATDAPARLAMVLASLLCGAVFWGHLYALLRRGGVALPGIAAVLALALGYPGSLYLLTGYSEALSLAASFAFLFWASHGGRGAGVLAAVAGIVLTATRVPGAVPPLVVAVTTAVAVLPRRNLLSDGPAWRQLWQRTWFCAVAYAGIGGFFLYLLAAFGHFDLYFQSVRAGWGQSTQPHVLLTLPLVVARDLKAILVHHVFEPQMLSRAFTLAAFSLGFLLVWRIAVDRHTRPPARLLLTAQLVVTALILLGLSGAADAGNNWPNMARHAMPAVVALMAAVALWWPRPALAPTRLRLALAGVAVAFFAGWATQLWFFSRFVVNLWVS